MDIWLLNVLQRFHVPTILVVTFIRVSVCTHVGFHAFACGMLFVYLVYMKRATLIRSLSDWTGDARVYQLSLPHCGYDYVIVSATNVVFQGPETYIFGTTLTHLEQNTVADWLELSGSFKGGWSHEEALQQAGYEV